MSLTFVWVLVLVKWSLNFRKMGSVFFWKSDDSALESLELSTLKTFDLKKDNWDFIFIKKNDLLGLILTDITKIEDQKNFDLENRKKKPVFG